MAKTQRWSTRNTERVRTRADATSVSDGEYRKSAETRERILEAAVGALVAEGYQRLTVASVAQRANLTRAAAIYHFASREILLQAIVDYLFDKRLLLYWAAVRDVPEGPGQISAFVEAYWEQARSDAFVAFIEIIVASRTDKVIGPTVQAALVRFEQERKRYSLLVFPQEFRSNAGARFDLTRDVARFLIEGMALVAMTSRMEDARVEDVKQFVVRQMELAYLGKS